MRRQPGSRVMTVAMALLCGVSFAVAGARANNAKIEGAARDTTGAGIAQATVILKVPAGAEKRAVTDGKGAFSFGSLSSGAYAVTIDAPGFQRTRYTNIALTDEQTRQFDFTLQSGAVSETVEIDITRPPAPSTNRESRTVFSSLPDFRADEFSAFPSIVVRPNRALRLSGQLINQVVSGRVDSRPQWNNRQIAWRQLRVTLEPAPIAFVSGDRVVLQRATSACVPPARASFASAVTSEGRFDFSLQPGVYDLCVFSGGGVAPGAAGGGASRGSGAAWSALAGPFSIAVDRDIDSLLVDIARR